jgi:hypothetical protein
MAETDTDIVANWHDRVSTLRKRGRISDAALAVVPADEIDVRRGRPPAPERLSEAERALWDHLVFSRRPDWFAGAESLLESFVVTTIQGEHIEAALRQTPVEDACYAKLARLHRGTVALAATLATRLRLTPHSRIDKNRPQDGDLPVA